MNSLDARVLRRHKKLFQAYNQQRKQLTYALSPEKASVAFEIIPALLSVNLSGLPGYVAGGDDICGISRTGSAREVKKVLQDYFPETVTDKIGFQKFFIQRSVIESLFLIGSTGTAAQTNRSDFDYWVCYDQLLLSERQARQLREKTAQIASWCEQHLEMEVHFFVSDIEHIRQNDFGRVDEESTGSSQRKLLKEECYRTLLLVAGKIPFWCVVAPGISQSQYDTYWQQLPQQAPYDLVDYIDLGFIADIDRQEFLGAALWQLSKGLKDPYKAVVKMTVLERYLSPGYAKLLLCDIVKEKILSPPARLQDVDPYLIVVQTVLAYYAKNDKASEMELLRRAFYLKAAPNMTRMRLKLVKDDYKMSVFHELLAQWEWSLEKFEYLNQIRKWGYARHLQFAQKINDFFFRTYARLKVSSFDGSRQAIAQADLDHLKRKLYVCFARQAHKIQTQPFLSRRRAILDRCVFRYKEGADGRPHWVLYDATRYMFEQKSQPAKIFSAGRLATVAAWVVVNGLFDAHLTVIDMPPNPSGINVNDLIELLKHLQSIFEPAANQVKLEEHFDQQAQIERIMVVVDIEKGQTILETETTLDLIHQNTWGEVFAEMHSFYPGLRVLKRLMAEISLNDAESILGRVKVHLPKHKRRWEGRKQIEYAIFKSMRN